MRRKELWQKIATRDCGVKQYKYLYRRMLDDEVIRKAYKKLRKGKTKRIEILMIDANLDAEVEGMKRMIETQSRREFRSRTRNLHSNRRSINQNSSTSMERRGKSTCRKYTNSGCTTLSFW